MSEERGISATWELLLAIGAVLGLTRPQFNIILKVMWVLAVTTHIAWVCGLLTGLGLSAPFASASEVEELHHAAVISAKLQLTQELRVQTLYWCEAKDDSERDIFYQTLERLKGEYMRITKGDIPPSFKCPEAKK